MFVFKLLVWLLIGGTACICAQSLSSSGVNGGSLQQCDAYLTAVTSFGFSRNVLVSRMDQIVFNKAYGLAVHEKGIPNTPQTLLGLASISKQFVSAPILKFEMMGKLKTSDPISKYVKDVPADKARITADYVYSGKRQLIFVRDCLSDAPSIRAPTVLRITRYER